MEERSVILFDGVCNLCNFFVQFIIKRDKKKAIHFAALQSETGQKMLADFGVQNQNLNTVIFIDQGNVFTHSDVALEVGKKLGNGWQFFYILKFIPKSFRDVIYNYIARNRYKWFGKKESCMIPTPDIKSRFID